MPTVSVNSPKTPVTAGSSGLAMATLPNVCKMPPPPPPFAPTPLPNIGQSGKMPQNYSTTVKIEGFAVAIRGSMFGSTGDIASKATGGGIISSNAEGPTKFIAPGSLDVQIEGKNVQLLGDQMLNNCGPTGMPANSATMGGVLQPASPAAAQGAALGILGELNDICNALCDCLAAGEYTNCISARLKAEDAASGGMSTVKAETPYSMDTTPPSPCPYPGDRRPDTVIVIDPTKPATQDNLRAVVEIKLKKTRDRYRGDQKQDFELIAGDPEKLVTISERDCKCDDDDRERVPVPVTKPETEKEKEREFKLPPWAIPVAATVVALGVVALVVATAPASVPVLAAVGVAAAAVAVFGNFSSGQAAPGA